MSVFITGDVHGTLERFSNKNFKRHGIEPKPNDIFIVCGDFGIPWGLPRYTKEEQHWIKWFGEKPYQIAFCDGNHENFDLLNSLPSKIWNSGEVHIISHNIFHMKRGEVFNIEGNTYFVFGGAESIDKEFREPGITWWKEEIPTIEEFQKGALKLLNSYNNKIDYVITHAPPEYLPGYNDRHNDVTNMLKLFKDNISYKEWFFGHMHFERYYYEDRMRCMYKNFVKI